MYTAVSDGHYHVVNSEDVWTCIYTEKIIDNYLIYVNSKGQFSVETITIPKRHTSLEELSQYIDAWYNALFGLSLKDFLDRVLGKPSSAGTAAA